ncbi:hypothetical protein SLS62_003681 [Diatrype stigma]|uniref:Uncharacterized protein n=1 Tax=Diatrype stigma TaxID=117547 RepID=A0AAN9V6F8_9PEZI
MDNVTSVFAFVSAGLRTGRAIFNPRQFWAAEANGPTTESAGVQTSISFTPRAELEVRPPKEDDENPAVTVQVSYGKSAGQKRGRDPTQALDGDAGASAGPPPKKSCLKKVGSVEDRFGSALFGGRQAEAHARAYAEARATALDRAQVSRRRQVRFYLPLDSPSRGPGSKRSREAGEEDDDREVKRLRLEKQNCEISIEILKEKLSKSGREKDELAKKCAILEEAAAAASAANTSDREASPPPAAGSEPAAGLQVVETGGQTGACEADDVAAEVDALLAGSGSAVAAPGATTAATVTITTTDLRRFKDQLAFQRKKVRDTSALVISVMRETGWGDPRRAR